VRDLASQPPVIRYVNFLVRDAVDCRASDIHLEAAKGGLAVRYRIDGVLSPAPEPPSDLQQAVVSRIKLVADLDIAERRRPQDGRIRVRLDQRELDLRVSTIPTLYGESVALRLLEQADRPVALSDLGLPDRALNLVEQLVRRPHGMLLASGPTGSGKTTTLYSALNELNHDERNVMTIEDPVEYTFQGVNQIQINRLAGITFANGLRGILRQDPDVILVGEIRDKETGEISVQSALTGHLVLSSLHATDAVGALYRLLEMGVESFMITSAVIGVVAQRLVRRVCPQCSMTYEPSTDERSFYRALGGTGFTFHRGAGCNYCSQTGFRGRIGVFEVLRISDAIRRLLVRDSPPEALRFQAISEGMRPLRSAGIAKIDEGLTTITEVMRSVHLGEDRNA
jgi:type IV pilus assembly protein PilB